MGYTFFFDESGQAGIAKIRSDTERGASPYMVLGGVLIRDDMLDESRSKLKVIADELELKDGILHCVNLSHPKTIYVAAKVAKTFEMVAFGVISKKSTLGGYRSKINVNHAFYYNKCVQYILECVGHWAELNGVTDIKIVCEKIEAHDYGRLGRFISACRKNPQHDRTKFLRNIDPRITALPKSDECLLGLADLVAYSVYQSINKTPKNYNIPEWRYFFELRQSFFGCPQNMKILNFGLKPIHTIEEIDVVDDVMKLFSTSRSKMQKI